MTWLVPSFVAQSHRQLLGMPTRLCLTRLKVDKACKLLEMMALPVLEIALKVAYPSTPVLASVFRKQRLMCPPGIRRAVREPVCERARRQTNWAVREIQQ